MAYKRIFSLVREANVIFDREAPWLSRKSSQQTCAATLYKVSLYILNIAILIQLFLPSTSKKILAIYQVEEERHWGPNVHPDRFEVAKT